MKCKVTDTDGIFRLAKLASKLGLNRQIDVNEVIPRLDPEGVHVVASSFLHDDGDVVRARWLLKPLGDGGPIEAWLDVPVGAFNGLATWDGETKSVVPGGPRADGARSPR